MSPFFSPPANYFLNIHTKYLKHHLKKKDAYLWTIGQTSATSVVVSQRVCTASNALPPDAISYHENSSGKTNTSLCIDASGKNRATARHNYVDGKH